MNDGDLLFLKNNDKKIIYKGKYFELSMVWVVIVWILEDIHAMSVNKFIVFRNYGVLDKNTDGFLVIILNEVIVILFLVDN